MSEPDRCQACWAEAEKWAWGGLPMEDRYQQQLANHREWPSEWTTCGGISSNGTTPSLCEAHMQPWGHRREHSAALHAPQKAE